MKTKITYPLLIVSALFFSCKKDRTCSCTISRTGSSTTTSHVEEKLFTFTMSQDTSYTNSINDVKIVDKVITNVSKSTAKTNCISYSQPFNETNITAVPSSSIAFSATVTNTGTEKYDCKLQ